MSDPVRPADIPDDEDLNLAERQLELTRGRRNFNEVADAITALRENVRVLLKLGMTFNTIADAFGVSTAELAQQQMYPLDRFLDSGDDVK